MPYIWNMSDREKNILKEVESTLGYDINALEKVHSQKDLIETLERHIKQVRNIVARKCDGLEELLSQFKNEQPHASKPEDGSPRTPLLNPNGTDLSGLKRVFVHPSGEPVLVPGVGVVETHKNIQGAVDSIKLEVIGVRTSTPGDPFSPSGEFLKVNPDILSDEERLKFLGKLYLENEIIVEKTLFGENHTFQPRGKITITDADPIVAERAATCRWMQPIMGLGFVRECVKGHHRCEDCDGYRGSDVDD